VTHVGRALPAIRFSFFAPAAICRLRVLPARQRIKRRPKGLPVRGSTGLGEARRRIAAIREDVKRQLPTQSTQPFAAITRLVAKLLNHPIGICLCLDHDVQRLDTEGFGQRAPAARAKRIRRRQPAYIPQVSLHPTVPANFLQRRRQPVAIPLRIPAIARLTAKVFVFVATIHQIAKSPMNLLNFGDAAGNRIAVDVRRQHLVDTLGSAHDSDVMRDPTQKQEGFNYA
jgi:hypothetical protein